MKKIMAITGVLGFFVSQALFVSAGYFNSDPIIRCEQSITRYLSVGSENMDVSILQSILVSNGYLKATPNGYFGHQTRYAVQAFQRDNEVSPTGTVGPMTRELLNESVCGGTSYSSFMNSFGSSAYSTGVTYVAPQDPFVIVITPPVAPPVVYATPQSFISQPSVYQANVYQPTYQSTGAGVYTPSSVSSQIASTQVVYNPASGYSYGITPASGSVSVSSPIANSVYSEGDTVIVRWTTNNIATSAYTIRLESNIAGQSVTVATVTGSSYSFILTKALLDSVCSGVCNNYQQGSFRVVLTTTTTDIAGITSTLRAAVAPITINRPLSYAQVTIGSSKTPVNSGEVFKLYINVPVNTSYYGNNTVSTNGAHSVRIKAVCPSSVTASIAGVSCGQEFTVPETVIKNQQEIPAVITNPTFYKQTVTFQITVVNLAGQIIGTSATNVSVNGSPFSW